MRDEIDEVLGALARDLVGEQVIGLVASDTDRYMGSAVGSGQCVAFVQAAAGAPNTGQWSQGPVVRGNNTIPAGSVIATFQDGQYKNKTNGDSHAAIYLGQNDEGIFVRDQWKGQPVHERLIRFQGGGAKPVNDGDAYALVVA